MKTSPGALILRAHAIYLIVASILGTGMDIALGFLEAHGLAFILGCVISLPVGYLATSGHWFFAILQLMAASARVPAPRPSHV